MANMDVSRPLRRRLRTAAALTVAPLAALLFLATPASPGHAPTKAMAAEPPSRTTPTPTPTCTFDPITLVECSPSSSPANVVISPVPLDSPSPAVTPSYLIGIPSPSPPGADIGGTPIPLGGGFNDLPSPGPVSAVSDGGSGGGGSPTPLVLIGMLLLVAAAGSVLWAIAPKGERFPEKPAPGASGLVFTPHGPDSPELMVMDHGPERPARSRARRPRPGI